MKKFLILFLAVLITPLIAGIYGAIHDQVTYSISEEYFTKFKYDQFGFDPSWFGGHRQTVAVIGFLATWWTGVPIGVILGFIGLLHNDARTMTKSIMKAILIVFLTALAFGVLGYFYGYTLLNDNLSWEFPDGLVDRNSFILVGSTHNFSYLGGIVGLLLAIVYQVLLWRRLKKIT